LRCDGTGDDDGEKCRDCYGSGDARCERRRCMEVGVIFNEYGELLCEEHAFEEMCAPVDEGANDVYAGD
jgi:hypothetical protein